MKTIIKTALVTGAGGFVGHHLTNRLKKEGYWVRGVDIKRPEFSKTRADEFKVLDLRFPKNCAKALTKKGGFDEVYHLAAEMGGLGYLDSAECDIMRNSALMDIEMVHAAITAKARRYFFSSSVCIYPDMRPGAPEVSEAGAYPANPHNEYGWEKLYAERITLTYGRNNKVPVRIARFQNCYGPEGVWRGGREKSPAAICRKVAEAKDGGTVEIWGDGSAVRTYIYIDDMIDAIRHLMRSRIEEPVNIGTPEYVTVRELVDVVAEAAGKNVRIKSVPGPVGVRSRNFSNKKINSTGWKARFKLNQGIELTYAWIEKQVIAHRKSSPKR